MFHQGQSSSTVVHADVDHLTFIRRLKSQVKVLEANYSWRKQDRFRAWSAARMLVELARKEDVVGLIVKAGAVPVLVKHLNGPPMAEGDERCIEFEVELECLNALILIALKSEYRQCIVDEGALTPLMNVLKMHKSILNSEPFLCLLKNSAFALTVIASENNNVKNYIRIMDGIQALVELLQHPCPDVQSSAATALQTLAFLNDENKNQIIECNALPVLILMLRSEDASIHFEALGVIGSLIHLSPNLKKLVLEEGALQPIIELLSSSCTNSQKEAALLLGQFSTNDDSDCKIQIAQRGAVRPLIKMLESEDIQLKEMATFALGRLAQDSNTQAGIVYNGGLVPLLKLLDSKNGPLQYNAAFSLYGIAGNEDNISDFIKMGGFQKLQDVEIILQETKDCVLKTLERMEEKINGRVLRHLLYLMRVGDRVLQERVALALAHLCSSEDIKTIFLDNNGLDLLLGLLVCTNAKQQQDASVALFQLANKFMELSMMNAPLIHSPQVYLGEHYVNNAIRSDVTFLVEGRYFFAHRMALIASSDAFHAMFGSEYREKNARIIEIPNIGWEIFELMMRFIYTGRVEVTPTVAQGLLIAADQYLLEGLKRSCEYAIAKDLNIGNISTTYDFAEAYNAMMLKLACCIFILKFFSEINSRPEQSPLVERIVPEIHNYFRNFLQDK